MDDPDWSKQTHPLIRENVEEHQKALADLPKQGEDGDDPDDNVDPVCDSDVTLIPWNVFSPGIYEKFCDKVKDSNDGKDSVAWIVDSAGNRIPPKVKARRLQPRTPPPNPETWADYLIELEWSGGDGNCDHDCETMYRHIADSPCKPLPIPLPSPPI